MKITKYEHACMVAEEAGKKLVIDPGEFTPDFGDATDVAAVVITHVHGDHFSKEHLQTIIDKNPDVQLFTTAEVAEALPDAKITVTTPKAGTRLR